MPYSNTMIAVRVTASGPDAPGSLVLAPSMQHLFVTLRGLPYAKLEIHGPVQHPGTEGVDFLLPEDETKLTQHLLRESDKGHVQ